MHASTIELLAELEVGDRLVDRGQVMRRIVMVDRGRPLISIQLDDLPSSYPFALGVPQSTTEELLARRLDALGGSVRREWCVEALAQSRDEVAVTGFDHSGPEPVPFELRARFVIGADGSHSVVRSAIGLDFPGDTYARHVRPRGHRTGRSQRRRRRGHDQPLASGGHGAGSTARRQPADGRNGRRR